MTNSPQPDGSHDDLPQGEKDILEWQEAFDQTDRGMVVCCVAIVDDLLSNLVAEFLEPHKIDSDKDVHRLFDTESYGPLSSINAKRMFAACLGLIDPDIDNDIRLFCKLRNRFAHDREAPSFRDPDTHKILRKLKHPTMIFDDSELEDLNSTESFFMIAHVDSPLTIRPKPSDPLARLLFMGTFHHIFQILTASCNKSG